MDQQWLFLHSLYLSAQDSFVGTDIHPMYGMNACYAGCTWKIHVDKKSSSELFCSERGGLRGSLCQILFLITLFIKFQKSETFLEGFSK